jgi:AcrR family transcriptional regulator
VYSSATAVRASEGGRPRADHRTRLISAMGVSVEQKGFRDTAVADVVRIARTSRRSFYEHFRDREACFIALFEATTEEMMRAVGDAVSRGPWQQQVDAALRGYFDSVAARPRLFRSFARELPALGRAGAERQRAVLERFADTLVGLAESGDGKRAGAPVSTLGRDAAIMIVSGLRELTVSALEQRRELDELSASAAPIVKAIIAAAVLD